MLNLVVNGLKKKMNIGCRTFVSLVEVLHLLNSKSGKVQLNGQLIPGPEFAKIMVSTGDTLELK